jgi:ABC-type transport system involved in cytochrome c biogenesis permease subunit
MSRAIKRNEPILGEFELSFPEKLAGLWPVLTPFAAAVFFVLARLYVGPRGMLYEGALTMLALICYISAAVLMVTNLFVKERVLQRLSLITAVMGASFNLSGWMIRWIEAGDAEGWRAGINGIWRYVPLDNLYPLTLGFCFGAAITTLAIIRKPKYGFVGALSMPLISVILTLAILLGNHISTLPPILDSYWRPIHVSVATIGYGVCLVSFGLAFAYLLKDGVRSEAIAISIALFGILVYGTVGRFAVPFHAEYGASLFVGKSSLPVRAVLPGVGPLMALALAVITASLALFTIDLLKGDQKAKRWGWRLFRGATVLQALVIAVLFFQVNSAGNPASRIPQREMAGFGQWLARQMEMSIPPAHYSELAGQWIGENSTELAMSLKSNPVEVGGLLGLFVALFMVSLFAWKREQVVAAMPSLQSIDSLLYKTVGVAFPLLTLLLITGAVWANESWGRYWGWDSKEVGALVAWLAYAGFLHTRISHGWRGRRSAYFALLGFALVIFTWLGVSYLLPGLHSYA